MIESLGQKITGPLFDKHPEVGDMVNKKLCADLSAQIPLALYADEKGTLGKNQEYSFDKLVSDLKTKDFGNLSAENQFVRLAGVIITWNVFQHF